MGGCHPERSLPRRRRAAAAALRAAPARARRPRAEHRIAEDTLPGIRAIVAEHAREAGVSGQRTGDLVLATHEVASNSVRHGGGEGMLRVWHDDGTVICEVRDRGRLDQPLAGRARPALDAESGWGLWLANQLCDLVQMRTLPDGNVVRLHLR